MKKTELLYDHYKETILIIKDNLIQRNSIFVMDFIVINMILLYA